VKDRVFSGPDVEEALAVAAASLGLPRSGLRYVVLDPGSAGGRGLMPTPARVAIPPPELGEHTDEILRGLGYDGAAIADFQRTGVIA
jgi:crotonobetainyl-CoA:carnitine CoA-transferase CaiB-like acyl-CoA transferase